MTDILIRREGQAGRITLNRPQALNALSYAMCKALDGALRDWATDPAVTLVILDATGDRAFCAGGDIAELYAEGTRGNFAYGQEFWRDEYRMNARIAEYGKPVISFIQGFCMGGGVGVACHARLRIVGESAQIAMPECGIGLVPDVGGSAILARAPGKIGTWAGLTGARLGPADAIHAGFADRFVPEADCPRLISALCATGDMGLIPDLPPPAPSRLPALRAEIDRLFDAPTLAALVAGLDQQDSEFAREALKALARVSPLAAACTLEHLRRLGPSPDLRHALSEEYNFTHRAQAQSDFLEGIRAMIIDKDRKPRWRHARAEDVTPDEVAQLLAPLGPDALTFSE